MKIGKLSLMMRDDFEPGECYNCPLSYYDSEEDGDYRCPLHYRFCDCPIQLEDYSYAMDEEDITD